MDKVRADYSNANKQFKKKYNEVTKMLDPTFMLIIMNLSKSFIGMKDKYDTLLQLDERVDALEKRIEGSGHSAQKVIKEGYLNIKTTFSWQREYFVIKEGKFFHLSTGKITNQYSVTSVRLYNQKAAAMKFIDADRCFEVICDKKKSSFVLQAQSKQERDAWFTELSNIVTTTQLSSAQSQSQSQSQQQQQQLQQQPGDGEPQNATSGLFKGKTRFASVSGPNTGPSNKQRSKSPDCPRSLSPSESSSQLTWEELKASDVLQKPVSYTKRASSRKSDAKNIKIAGIPPWALNPAGRGSENIERLSLFPPLMLSSFYKEFTYVESNSTAFHHVDRSEDIFAAAAAAAAAAATTASSSASATSTTNSDGINSSCGSTSSIYLNVPSHNSLQDRNENSRGCQTRLRSYSCSTNVTPVSQGTGNDTCKISVNTDSVQPQQQHSPATYYQTRKRATMLRRKKTVDEIPEITCEDFTIDTDKVTEGLTFTELVRRLTETERMVGVINADLQKVDDLDKLNGAMKTLHTVKGHLTFMSNEHFEPETTVDDAAKRISELSQELSGTINDISSSLELVVPDNSSSWAFYVQPISDAYINIIKYKTLQE